MAIKAKVGKPKVAAKATATKTKKTNGMDRCPICGAQAQVLGTVDSQKYHPTSDPYAHFHCSNPDCLCRMCPVKCKLGYYGWVWDRRFQKTWTRQEIVNRVGGDYMSKKCPYLNSVVYQRERLEELSHIGGCVLLDNLQVTLKSNNQPETVFDSTKN